MLATVNKKVSFPWPSEFNLEAGAPGLGNLTPSASAFIRCVIDGKLDALASVCGSSAAEVEMPLLQRRISL